MHVFKEFPSDKGHCYFGEVGYMMTCYDGIENGGHWLSFDYFFGNLSV